MRESDTFTIHFEGHVTVQRHEIWPDGDAPADPTAEDVAESIRREFPHEFLIPKWLNDWNLLDGTSVHVDGVEVWPVHVAKP